MRPTQTVRYVIFGIETDWPVLGPPALFIRHAERECCTFYNEIYSRTLDTFDWILVFHMENVQSHWLCSVKRVTWRLNCQSGAQIRSRGVHSTNHNGYSMKLRKSSILEWVTVSFIENRTLNMKFSIGAIVRAFASSGWDHHLKGYHDVTVWNQDGVPDGRFRVADLMVSLIDADNRSPAWTQSLMTPTGRLSTFFFTEQTPSCCCS